MSELNASIRNIPIPARMARRPVSAKGFPVPYFVTHKDAQGEWDFRVITGEPIFACVKRRLCWLCGETLGQYLCFTIGPMCSINRVSSEPPSHRDCAEYAVKACPFLSKPNMRRNEVGLPEGSADSFVGGIGVKHNPGATLLWITKSYRIVRDHGGGVLFEIGPPLEIYFYKEGRIATRAEIDAAIAKGLPLLREIANTEGQEALDDLEKKIKQAQILLPAE
jgi:hypothetical protein